MNEQYPKTMIVQYPHGKMQWTRDYGVVGVYQPSTTFDSCKATHTENECRNIRRAYRAESLEVVMVGGNMGGDWDYTQQTDQESIADDMRTAQGVM